MADNFTYTPGTGETGGADDIGGVKFPRVKLIHGADGTNDGDISSTNGLPIQNDDTDLKVTLDSEAVVLGASSAAIGKLAANSGVDIGDVDVTSCALPTGAATAAKQGIGGTDLVGGAGAVAAGVQRVTLASDDPAVAKLGTIDTDTGSIATDASTIAGDTTSIDGKITACNTGAVVLAAGTAAIGKLAANSGVDIGDVDVASIAAGDNNIGNVDIASAIPAGDNNIGNVDIASAIPAGTNIIGAVKQDVVNWTPVRKYYTSAGAATDGIVWSPASGKKWVLTDLIINVSAAATVTLEDDLAGGDSAWFKAELAANGGLCKRFNTPIYSGENDADLIVTTSAGNVYITAVGYEV